MRLSDLVLAALDAIQEYGNLEVAVPELTCADCDQGAYALATTEVGTPPVWSRERSTTVNALRFLVH